MEMPLPITPLEDIAALIERRRPPASMASAPAPTPTVVSLKQSFIAAQVNLLSQPPAPSRAWRAANDASEAPIPSRALDDALTSLGQTVQQHCRRVYAPQASRNVAEQISNAYSRDADRRVDTEADVDDRGRIGKELNLGRCCGSPCRTHRADSDAQPTTPPSRPSRRPGPLTERPPNTPWRRSGTPRRLHTWHS